MKKRILATTITLATMTLLATTQVHAEVTHTPRAYTAIPVKVAKAKADTTNMETHWWVFNKGEIHEFLTFEERGTINLGNAYPTIICDCMWDESETDNTDGYCPYAFIPNLDEPQELSHELNKKGTRVTFVDFSDMYLYIDKNLDRITDYDGTVESVKKNY